MSIPVSRIKAIHDDLADLMDDMLADKDSESMAEQLLMGVCLSFIAGIRAIFEMAESERATDADQSQPEGDATE